MGCRGWWRLVGQTGDPAGGAAWQRCTFFAGMMTNASKRDSRYMLFSLAFQLSVRLPLPASCGIGGKRIWRRTRSMSVRGATAAFRMLFKELMEDLEAWS